MSKKHLFYIVPAALIVASILTVSLVFVAMRSKVEVYESTDGIADAIGSLRPRVIELGGVTAKQQPDGFSCGITAVTIISNYYNSADNEANALMEKYGTKGNTYDDMIKALRGELPGRAVTQVIGATDVEMLGDIHASLGAGDPVLINFGSANPYNYPHYDFHASVVYGIDLESETITIANAYGYIEEITLVDFLNRMSYRETRKYPLIQQLVLVLSDKQSVNSYFLIT